ncbi:hypothetical protein DDE18_09120 [Nocardioides gansuensis]|uniref:Winged helix DNA-binding domain-containing protein n=1 Tax=Nocardioides gansuensis TaxID=2138300 RepID=A0A2T8FCL2_9ACTN|nr:winged helix DNA-binding domain-containing protein [Nocardioides gansuensis]PVG83435.1 hypothetical protein DDE18_09120 [Nocardioides gansuensis]
MGVSFDDLRGLALARQFPDGAASVAGLVAVTGPIQSQTARSPFLGLAARRPGTTHAEVTAAYESGDLVRGSTLRGTVHTCTAAQHPLLHLGTRAGQRTRWQQLLKLEHGSLDDLWDSTEAFARDEWRTPAELIGHLHEWLERVEGRDEVTTLQVGRYLAFGHGGLVRRPLKGPWSGQGAPVYRAATAVIGEPAAEPSLDDLVRLHLRCHGPASRQDIAWWSGLGLRAVGEVLDRLGLVGEEGPDGRTYVDLPGGPPPREPSGVLLLPEFDALMCGYDPPARVRFAEPEHVRRLWLQANGMVLPPLLVDGRITGYWRATGSARTRPLEVVHFTGTRRPRKAELEAPVAALEAALDIAIAEVTVSRESV